MFTLGALSFFSCLIAARISVSLGSQDKLLSPSLSPSSSVPCGFTSGLVSSTLSATSVTILHTSSKCSFNLSYFSEVLANFDLPSTASRAVLALSFFLHWMSFKSLSKDPPLPCLTAASCSFSASPALASHHTSGASSGAYLDWAFNCWYCAFSKVSSGLFQPCLLLHPWHLTYSLHHPVPLFLLGMTLAVAPSVLQL